MKKVTIIFPLLTIIAISCWYLFFRGSAEEAASVETKATIEEKVGKIKPLVPKNVFTDPKTGTMFVNDQILVMFKDGTKKEEVEKIVNEINGKIVGNIIKTNDYQIELKNAPEPEKLKQMAEDLKKKESVIAVSLNYVYEDTEDAADYKIPPNDDWDTKAIAWDGSLPKGNNWHLEAIRAEEAWQAIYGKNGKKTKKQAK